MRGAECCSVCVPCPSRFPRVLVSSAAASTGHHGGRPLSVEAHGGRSHGLSPGSSQQAFGGHGRWSFPARVRRPRPRGAQERVGSLALTRPLFLSQVLGTQPCSPSLRPPVGPLVAPPAVVQRGLSRGCGLAPGPPSCPSRPPRPRVPSSPSVPPTAATLAQATGTVRRAVALAAQPSPCFRLSFL